MVRFASFRCNIRRFAGISTLALAIWSPAIFGQVFTATLTGVVTDPTSGAIPKASVSLTNTATNEQRSTTAGADGRYEFPQLLPGTYELTAEAPGFKKFIQQGIGLRANQTAEVNVRLEVGATSESVQVTASAGVLETQTADQSLHIETNTLANLPINTRTPFAVVWANAGVSEAFVDTRNSTGDQNLDRFGINGGRTETAAILIDGVSATSSSQWNGLYYSPTLESVQEVQLVRNSYDAEYGRSGGAVFSVVSKGGSPDFHGGRSTSCRIQFSTPLTISRIGTAARSHFSRVTSSEAISAGQSSNRSGCSSLEATKVCARAARHRRRVLFPQCCSAQEIFPRR